MTILTESERVRVSRRMVIELLASSVDLSTAPGVDDLVTRYGGQPARYGPPAAPAAEGERDSREPGHHEAPEGEQAETVAQPVKIDNDLYMRDYSKCILCYKCVEACGVDAQNTFAIAVAGRGFDARISTAADVPLPDPACVYCGNCIGGCPTGPLMFKREHAMPGPPTTVMPSGRRSSEPVPVPSASGKAPSSAAIVVIKIGRNRCRHARWTASLAARP